MVVMIFVSIAGLRYVFEATITLIVDLDVTSAMADITEKASKMGPSDGLFGG
jgi:hypothetical protein